MHARSNNLPHRDQKVSVRMFGATHRSSIGTLARLIAAPLNDTSPSSFSHIFNPTKNPAFSQEMV